MLSSCDLNSYFEHKKMNPNFNLFTGSVGFILAGSKGNKTFYAKWEKNAEENSSGNSSGNSSSGSSSEKESTETTAGCNSSMIGGTLGGAAILSCVLAFTKKRRSNKK